MANQPSTSTLADAKAEVTRLRRLLLELEKRRRRRELVAVDQAGDAIFKHGRSLRDQITGSWPCRAAPALAIGLDIDETTAWRALDRILRTWWTNVVMARLDDDE
jgi:hypothetical protein